ncbi:MAG: putative lipid II flippase FtsW [Candidatus Methylacidiphilales bacterium]|nr:putative lipid II flippase FtsW [Candidatus Methylacidiphilales bacterium]
MLTANPNQLLTSFQRQIGYIMLLTVLMLCVLGIVMLFSIDGRFAPQSGARISNYAMLQLRFMLIGGTACIVFACIDYRVLLKYAPLAVGIAIFLMLLCFVPGIGRAAKGSPRWLTMGGFNLQPSEFAKIALILFLSYWMSSRFVNSTSFLRGFVIPALISGLVALPILKSEDLGTTVLLMLIFVCILFVAGTRPIYLAGLFVSVISGIFFVAINIPQRYARLVAFLDPEEHKLGTGWQVLQALIALGSGGTTGVGLGMSRQKMDFLPECHTDFIFPIIGEEMGMIVTLCVVAAYLVFAICGCWISVHAPDNGGFYLGMGITCFITLQAMMNLFVVTSLMPNKGIALPFISYGGSSLLFCLIAVGILFNLHRQGVAGGTDIGGVVLPERTSPRM